MQMQFSDFPDLAKARILVIGDVMLDKYWSGQTARISPEAPVPVVKIGRDHVSPGGAANVAMNVRALGANVRLLGIVGEDEAAEELRASLESAKVQTHFISTAQHPTITKLRIISQNQQLIRLDFEEQLITFDNALLLEKFEKLLTEIDVIILSDYGKGTLAKAPAFIKIAREKNIPVLVDPKSKDFTLYQGATLIKPNRFEFEQAVGVCDCEEAFEVNAKKLINNKICDALLLTRSEHGMSLITADAVTHQSAIKREVYDVTGAGDTVIAAFACSLACTNDFVQAMQLANLAAGIVVTRAGTASVTAIELHREFLKACGDDRGVVTEQQLLLALSEAKERGERIVMTNGCFDILHAGHVTYLNEAKAMGDRLIIAVNDDQSVKKLKGNTRPINPLQRRMEVLAGLQAVDWVVPFTEDTPARLIAEVLPNVLVKGGDYTVNEIAGSDTVLENGGEVNIIEYVQNCSTSGIVDSILNEKTKEEVEA